MSKHTNRIIYFMDRYLVSYEEAEKMAMSEYLFERAVHDGTYYNDVDEGYLDALDARAEQGVE